MKIYVASSWRNGYQQAVVARLREAGHDVYDFRNPASGSTGFGWRQIEPGWLEWTPEQFRKALEHPIAREGFRLDMEALKAADLCVLVLPCGRSAHLELGYARGAGARTAVLMPEQSEPELMYRMVDLVALDVEEIVDWIKACWWKAVTA